jgi:tRNA threonylcarbamoyl adenosine modification protein (Sua5/YciO/YrdC/YwlC family)
VSGGEARIFRVNPRRPGAAAVRAAAEALQRGQLVILPTDTVYGVAAHPDVAGAVERIYAAKGRDSRKPLPLLIADMAEVARWGGVMGWRSRHLAHRYWPGPLTLVVEVGAGTEGFRVPAHAVARAVLKAAGGSLRVTSANCSGAPAAIDAAGALAALAGHVSVVLDAGPAPGGIESTVVREESDGLRVLREGALPAGTVLAPPLALIVCTGNVCRSPMAEYLLRHWLGPDSAWAVASAGVAAIDGLPITPEAGAVLAEKGLNADGYRSQRLTPALVDAARIIVVMTSGHQESIRQYFPASHGKVFLLKSFGGTQPDADVADPIGQPLAVYRQTLEEMNAVMPDLVLDLQKILDDQAADMDGKV